MEGHPLCVLILIVLSQIREQFRLKQLIIKHWLPPSIKSSLPYWSLQPSQNRLGYYQKVILDTSSITFPVTVVNCQFPTSSCSSLAPPGLMPRYLPDLGKLLLKISVNDVKREPYY